MVYKIGFFILAGIALFLGGWNAKKYFNEQASPSHPTPTVTEKTTTPIPMPSLTAAPSPSQATDEVGIKQAMAQKHSKAISDAVIKISENTGTHAHGSVSSTGEMGGGWFLAYKGVGGWMIVDDGNGTVSCETIAPYDFPVAMVGECINASGVLIKRQKISPKASAPRPPDIATLR